MIGILGSMIGILRPSPICDKLKYQKGAWKYFFSSECRLKSSSESVWKWPQDKQTCEGLRRPLKASHRFLDEGLKDLGQLV